MQVGVTRPADWSGSSTAGIPVAAWDRVSRRQVVSSGTV
jgi:hypothetical protein